MTCEAFAQGTRFVTRQSVPTGEKCGLSGFPVRQQRPPPVRPLQEPVDRRLDTGLEAVVGPITQFGADLARVDGVAPVVPGPVGHEPDQPGGVPAPCRRRLGIALVACRP